MKRLTSALLIALLVAAASSERLRAFCGFYVAKADAKIFNKASKVIIARDGNRTIMTMANDFQGEPKEFAVVIPVPTRITRDQIHVGDQRAIDHLDAFTAPRLVEYFDDDPCELRMMKESAMGAAAAPTAMDQSRQNSRRLGVTIEATYTVGEYDILILSAQDSGGLETWLRQNGYRIPAGASAVLGSYIKQNMRFFVARVNLAEQQRLGFTYLRPLQVAYESPKFMLPIRLGTVNANGPQELFIYTLTRTGRVETTNYRTVKIPTDTEVPAFLKQEFPRFYTAMFDEQVRRENMTAVFLEYAWGMAWCDPCAADPLTNDELAKLGVFWTGGVDASTGVRRPMPSPAANVYVTRLHVRYDRDRFPEDLVFQETGNRENFQGRFIIRHAWTGAATCGRADEYRRDVGQRRAQEARTLASLTGWPLADIHRKMQASNTPAAPQGEDAWWRRIWR